MNQSRKTKNSNGVNLGVSPWAIVQELLVACEMAAIHVAELEEAWRSGALKSCDGQNGERANRNIDVRVALRNAIANAGSEVRRA